MGSFQGEQKTMMETVKDLLDTSTHHNSVEQ